MTRIEEKSEEISILLFLLNPLDENRGQVQFCQNLIANLFEKEIVHVPRNFRK